MVEIVKGSRFGREIDENELSTALKAKINTGLLRDHTILIQNFESGDGYTTNYGGGTGSVAFNNTDFELSTAASIGASATNRPSSSATMDFDNDMLHTFKLKVSHQDTDTFWTAGAGDVNSADFNMDEKSFGFIFGGTGLVDPDNKLYAFVGNGSTNTKTEITGITLTDYNLFSIVYTAGTDAEFFVNGVSKATISTDLPSGTASCERFFKRVGTLAATAKTINVEYSVLRELFD